MPSPIMFTGPYVRTNLATLREKAGRTHDPRHAFYDAMLSSESYEEYYQKVGGLAVSVANLTTARFTAYMEMRHARNQCGWIADKKR